MINQIYFDLDGVLVDLHGGFAAYHHVEYPYTQERRDTGEPADEAFEIWLEDQARWSDPHGACTTKEFWANLEPFPWARELFRAYSQAAK